MRNAKKGDIAQTRQWERGWDAHNTMQLQRLARLPLPEKIEWLEAAQRLVMHMAGARNSTKAEIEPE